VAGLLRSSWRFAGSLSPLPSGRSAKRGCRKKENGRPRGKTSKQEMDMGLLRFVKSAGAKIFGRLLRQG